MCPLADRTSTYPLTTTISGKQVLQSGILNPLANQDFKPVIDALDSI